MTRVAISSLQSSTHWLRTPISNMESTHIQNCLRMIFRDPIASLSGVYMGDFRESLAMATGPWGDAEGWFEDTLLDSEFDRLRADIQRRQKIEIALRAVEGDDFTVIREALDEVDVPSVLELAERARTWLVRQPTVVALTSELLARIIDGRTDVTRL